MFKAIKKLYDSVVFFLASRVAGSFVAGAMAVYPNVKQVITGKATVKDYVVTAFALVGYVVLLAAIGLAVNWVTAVVSLGLAFILPIVAANMIATLLVTGIWIHVSFTAGKMIAIGLAMVDVSHRAFA